MPFNRQTLGIIFQSCDGHCYYCGSKLEPFGTWEVDHMTPREQGGAEAFYNYVAACRPCNRGKGNRTVDEYRKAIHARALNHITSALELLAPPFTEPGTAIEKTKWLLHEAEREAARVDIIFYGEAVTLPRDDDDLFIGEPDPETSDPARDDEVLES